MATRGDDLHSNGAPWVFLIKSPTPPNVWRRAGVEWKSGLAYALLAPDGCPANTSHGRALLDQYEARILRLSVPLEV